MPFSSQEDAFLFAERVHEDHIRTGQLLSPADQEIAQEAIDRLSLGSGDQFYVLKKVSSLIQRSRAAAMGRTRQSQDFVVAQDPEGVFRGYRTEREDDQGEVVRVDRDGATMDVSSH